VAEVRFADHVSSKESLHINCQGSVDGNVAIHCARQLRVTSAQPGDDKISWSRRICSSRLAAARQHFMEKVIPSATTFCTVVFLHCTKLLSQARMANITFEQVAPLRNSASCIALTVLQLQHGSMSAKQVYKHGLYCTMKWL
jgi:hypothetical protein